MNSQLRAVAESGNIDELYGLIESDPHVLEHMDEIPFVETPLHIASSASVENLSILQFAVEIMRLKPSLAHKLNPQGLSPVHLALEHGKRRMVLRFININKDLVRVKGRGGVTPLHWASENEDIDLMVEFLLICPESIEDVNAKNETALHVAVKHGKHKSLKILFGWLQRVRFRDAAKIEERIFNWKDEEGNTILHVAASGNDSQAVKVLLRKSKLNLREKNFDNLTALQVAHEEEVKNMLRSAAASLKSNTDESSIVKIGNMLKLKPTNWETKVIDILRIRGDLSEEQRSSLLVVATLIVTSTYQSALSPPGGYKSDQKISNMPSSDFILLSFLNAFSVLISTAAILIMTPRVKLSHLLFTPLYYFVYCYLFSMTVISPTTATFIVSVSIFFLYTTAYTLLSSEYSNTYNRLKSCGVTRA